ncbi:amidohydrolase family protein [Dyadobacter subterraneus]|uniref:Amidohydrolase family protein n=1 Tax=Dyadobacter subterraneus TaxID=2773304 RepID=A0ABR9WDJ3_9BACT|nr:amidohydrolase family protein [Dyadobacter subterraneus]MBE9463567.1 amidohydrolase family protein [Dyadobacter subterraneus]
MKALSVYLIILLSLFPSFLFSQVQIRPLPEAGFEVRIKNFVDNIELVDTHEHLMQEFVSTQKSAPDFMFLLALYADDDIKSAGMGKPEFAELLTSKYTVMEKWNLVKPFWEMSKNTAYNRTVLLTIDKLFGIRDLNDDTVLLLSEKLKNSYNGKWYDYILKERAKIKYVIQDVGTERSNDPMFRYVEKFDDFIRIHSKNEVLTLGSRHDTQISTLDSYVEVLNRSFQDAIGRGIIGVKSALAYHRILKYDNVSKAVADSVFAKLMKSKNGKVFAFEEVKPFQDYIMHQIIQLAGKYDIPFQFHTGLQSGDGNIIDNANPSHMANLFLEYRNVKFVLFHGGFPFGGILSTQAKSFRNVYIDMCWSAVISPSYSERYLHEWIETVPANKIMAFGGDYDNVENAYGHSLIARSVVSNVLTEKVRTGYLSENEAIDIARRILHDNAINLFKIK